MASWPSGQIRTVGPSCPPRVRGTRWCLVSRATARSHRGQSDPTSDPLATVAIQTTRGRWKAPALDSRRGAVSESSAEAAMDDESPLDLPALIPEHFARFFAFFGPGHTEGIVPARIKELARLKIAALNDCDT
jgi:hypothetical protein